MNTSITKALEPCRLCLGLQSDENYLGIFDESGLRDGLLVKIWRVCGFLVSIDDDLPKRICGSCHVQLEAFVVFKSKVEDVQHRMQVSKLATAKYDISSMTIHGCHANLQAAPPPQPSSYGWDTLQTQGCSLEPNLSNNFTNPNSNPNPVKTEETNNRLVEVPVQETDKSLTMPYVEENLKEMAQLLNSFETAQEYFINVDGNLPSEINNRYDDIFNICSMEDGSGLIQQPLPGSIASNSACDIKKSLLSITEEQVKSDNSNALPSLFKPITSSDAINNIQNSINCTSSNGINKSKNSINSSPSRSAPLPQVNDQKSNQHKYSSDVTSVKMSTCDLPVKNDETKSSSPNTIANVPVSHPYASQQKSLSASETSPPEKRKRSSPVGAVEEELTAFYQMTCKDCALSFVSFAILQKHMKNVHKEKAVVVCCGLEMTAKKLLVAHMKQHKQQTHNSLRKQEPTSTTPTMSSASYFVKTGPLDITSCNRPTPKSSSVKSSLAVQEVSSSVTHDEKLERLQDESTKEDNVRLQPPAKVKKLGHLQCSICKEVFATTNLLRGHLVSSHIQFRCECPVCKKAFYSVKGLQMHMYIHSEKPCFCNFCKKKFATKGALTKHTKICRENHSVIVEDPTLTKEAQVIPACKENSVRDSSGCSTYVVDV